MASIVNEIPAITVQISNTHRSEGSWRGSSRTMHAALPVRCMIALEVVGVQE